MTERGHDIRHVWTRLLCIVLAIPIGIVGAIRIAMALPAGYHDMRDFELPCLVIGMAAIAVGANIVLNWIVRAVGRYASRPCP